MVPQLLALYSWGTTGLHVLGSGQPARLFVTTPLTQDSEPLGVACGQCSSPSESRRTHANHLRSATTRDTSAVGPNNQRPTKNFKGITSAHQSWGRTPYAHALALHEPPDAMVPQPLTM